MLYKKFERINKTERGALLPRKHLPIAYYFGAILDVGKYLLVNRATSGEVVHEWFGLKTFILVFPDLGSLCRQREEPLKMTEN